MKLILSEDLGQIELYKNKILNKNINVKNYYYLDQNIDLILNDLIQFDIFSSEGNIIFINNFSFSKIKKEEIDFVDTLSKIKDKDIYMFVNSKTIKNDYKKFFSSIEEFKKISKWNVRNFIQEYFDSKKYPCSKELILYISENINLDGLSIIAELNKIMLWDYSKLNKKIIDALITFNVDDNVFNLINNFLSSNTNELFIQLNCLERKNVDIREIFNIFIAQLFTFKLYKLHLEVNKNIQLLLNDFKIQKFQIDNWLNFLYKIDIKQINSLLLYLIDLEKEVMLGNKELKQSFKMFLLKGIVIQNEY